MAVRRIRRGDRIIAAWDAGLPPPPEAFTPEGRSAVIECYFFRWPEDGATYRAPEHPHIAEWGEALRATRPK